MTRLVLDFAARSNRPSIVGLALLLAGLLAAGMVTLDYLKVDAGHQALLRALASVRVKNTTSQSKQADTALVAQQIADVSARHRLDLSWPQLMEALDRARGKDVGYLAIEAEGHGGKVTLKAEARDSDAMLAFYQRLQTTPGLFDVILAEHELNDVDGVSSVGFTMKLGWGSK
jgi:hypothetical protein